MSHTTPVQSTSVEAARDPRIIGKGADGANLYATSTVDEQPGLVWHHRGGGKWAQGLPTRLKNRDLNKIQIRIPKRAILLPGAEQYITSSKARYNVVTAEHIDKIFADQTNIQKQPMRGFEGRAAHQVHGTTVSMIPALTDDGVGEHTLSDATTDLASGSSVTRRASARPIMPDSSVSTSSMPPFAAPPLAPSRYSTAAPMDAEAFKASAPADSAPPAPPTDPQPPSRDKGNCT